MGCNCGKKKERKMYYPPTETEEAKIVEEPIEQDTVEKFHAREMDAYAKRISEETIDWFNNIDVIEPLGDNLNGPAPYDETPGLNF